MCPFSWYSSITKKKNTKTKQFAFDLKVFWINTHPLLQFIVWNHIWVVNFEIQFSNIELPKLFLLNWWLNKSISREKAFHRDGLQEEWRRGENKILPSPWSFSIKVKNIDIYAILLQKMYSIECSRIFVKCLTSSAQLRRSPS